MNETEMKAASTRMVQSLVKDGASVGEGMVITAMTLAIMFKVDGVSIHEAINRFATIAKNVYQQESP